MKAVRVHNPNKSSRSSFKYNKSFAFKLLLGLVALACILYLIIFISQSHPTDNMQDSNIKDNSSTTEGDNQKAEEDYIKGPYLLQTSDYVAYRRINRDTVYFTQGLFMDTDSTLIESSGLYGQSTLQRYSLEDPNKKDFLIKLDSNYFGEGACMYDNKIYQLTWRENTLLVYSYKGNETPTLIDEIKYPPEFKSGWGITTDGKDFYVTDGSENIHIVPTDDKEFKVRKTLSVIDSKGNKFIRLNELEFIKGKIYANVWYKNYILEIDPDDGKVLRQIDFSKVINMERAKNSNIDVFNGIAYDKNNDRLILTGKNWSGYYIIGLKDF